MSGKNVCFALGPLIANVCHEPSVPCQHSGIVSHPLQPCTGIVERQPHSRVGIIVDPLSVKGSRVGHDGPEAPGDEVTMTIAVMNIGAGPRIMVASKVVSHLMAKGVVALRIKVEQKQK